MLSILRPTRQLPKRLQRLENPKRFFHPTSIAMVQVGDSIPSVDLYDGSPGNKVNIAELIGNDKWTIVGVPAAFSPGCSDHHVPSYLMHENIKNSNVVVVAVNDAFVMKAWAKKMDENNESKIRFLADTHSELTKALDLEFPGSEQYFGNQRGKRYAIQVEGGKVTKVSVEPDASKITVAGAQHFL